LTFNIVTASAARRVAIYNIDRAGVLAAHVNRPKVSITTPVYSHCNRRQAHSNLPYPFFGRFPLSYLRHSLRGEYVIAKRLFIKFPHSVIASAARRVAIYNIDRAGVLAAHVNRPKVSIIDHVDSSAPFIVGRD